MTRVRSRTVLRAIHRWLGLSLGLALVLLGLTGSLLVFHREIDHFVLNRDLWRAARPGVPLTLAQLAVRLKAQRPDATAIGADRPLFIGSAPSGYYEVATPAGETRFMVAALDPSTGRILGEYGWGELPPGRRNLMSVVYRLHYELFAGPTGLVIVGLIGIASLLMTGLGVYLWWPRDGRWRRALRIKRGAPQVRRQFDLHGLFGATGAIAIAVISFSGTYMAFPDQFHSGLASIMRVTPFLKPPAITRPAQPLEPSAIEAAVRRDWPTARYDSFGLADAGTGHRLTFREPGDPRTDYGSTVVFAHPGTGATLSRRTLGDMTAGDIFLRYQFPLHNGQALGLPGRILVAAAGLLPLVLGWTGMRLWWLRRNARRHVRTTSAPRPPHRRTGQDRPPLPV